MVPPTRSPHITHIYNHQNSNPPHALSTNSLPQSSRGSSSVLPSHSLKQTPPASKPPPPHPKKGDLEQYARPPEGIHTPPQRSQHTRPQNRNPSYSLASSSNRQALEGDSRSEQHVLSPSPLSLKEASTPHFHLGGGGGSGGKYHPSKNYHTKGSGGSSTFFRGKVEGGGSSLGSNNESNFNPQFNARHKNVSGSYSSFGGPLHSSRGFGIGRGKPHHSNAPHHPNPPHYNPPNSNPPHSGPPHSSPLNHPSPPHRPNTPHHPNPPHHRNTPYSNSPRYPNAPPSNSPPHPSPAHSTLPHSTPPHSTCPYSPQPHQNPHSSNSNTTPHQDLSEDLCVEEAALLAERGMQHDSGHPGGFTPLSVDGGGKKVNEATHVVVNEHEGEDSFSLGLVGPGVEGGREDAVSSTPPITLKQLQHEKGEPRIDPLDQLEPGGENSINTSTLQGGDGEGGSFYYNGSHPPPHTPVNLLGSSSTPQAATRGKGGLRPAVGQPIIGKVKQSINGGERGYYLEAKLSGSIQESAGGVGGGAILSSVGESSPTSPPQLLLSSKGKCEKILTTPIPASLCIRKLADPPAVVTGEPTTPPIQHSCNTQDDDDVLLDYIPDVTRGVTMLSASLCAGEDLCSYRERNGFFIGEGVEGGVIDSSTSTHSARSNDASKEVRGSQPPPHDGHTLYPPPETAASEYTKLHLTPHFLSQHPPKTTSTENELTILTSTSNSSSVPPAPHPPYHHLYSDSLHRSKIYSSTLHHMQGGGGEVLPVVSLQDGGGGYSSCASTSTIPTTATTSTSLRRGGAIHPTVLPQPSEYGIDYLKNQIAFENSLFQSYGEMGNTAFSHYVAPHPPHHPHHTHPHHHPHLQGIMGSPNSPPPPPGGVEAKSMSSPPPSHHHPHLNLLMGGGMSLSIIPPSGNPPNINGSTIIHSTVNDTRSTPFQPPLIEDGYASYPPPSPVENGGYYFSTTQAAQRGYSMMVPLSPTFETVSNNILMHTTPPQQASQERGILQVSATPLQATALPLMMGEEAAHQHLPPPSVMMEGAVGGKTEVLSFIPPPGDVPSLHPPPPLSMSASEPCLQQSSTITDHSATTHNHSNPPLPQSWLLLKEKTEDAVSAVNLAFTSATNASSDSTAGGATGASSYPRLNADETPALHLPNYPLIPPTNNNEDFTKATYYYPQPPAGEHPPEIEQLSAAINPSPGTDTLPTTHSHPTTNPPPTHTPITPAHPLDLDPELVGYFFTLEYYQRFYQGPSALTEIYDVESSLYWTSVPPPPQPLPNSEGFTVSSHRGGINPPEVIRATKKKEIESALGRITPPLAGVKTSIDNIITLPSLPSSFIISVTGKMWLLSGEDKKFLQTFVIAQRQPTWFFVLSDILCFTESILPWSLAPLLKAQDPQVVGAVSTPSKQNEEVERILKMLRNSRVNLEIPEEGKASASVSGVPLKRMQHTHIEPDASLPISVSPLPIAKCGVERADDQLSPLSIGGEGLQRTTPLAPGELLLASLGKRLVELPPTPAYTRNPPPTEASIYPPTAGGGALKEQLYSSPSATQEKDAKLPLSFTLATSPSTAKSNEKFGEGGASPPPPQRVDTALKDKEHHYERRDSLSGEGDNLLLSSLKAHRIPSATSTLTPSSVISKSLELEEGGGNRSPQPNNGRHREAEDNSPTLWTKISPPHTRSSPPSTKCPPPKSWPHQEDKSKRTLFTPSLLYEDDTVKKAIASFLSKWGGYAVSISRSRKASRMFAFITLDSQESASRLLKGGLKIEDVVLPLDRINSSNYKGGGGVGGGKFGKTGEGRSSQNRRDHHKDGTRVKERHIPNY